MKLIINGIPPYDGEYDLDFERLKNRDVEIIKRVSGYTPLEWSEAGDRGDTTFIVALGICMARRGGLVKVDEDLFWEAELGAITIDTEEDEALAGPPTSEPETPTTLSGGHGPTDGDENQVPSPRTIGMAS